MEAAALAAAVAPAVDGSRQSRRAARCRRPHGRGAQPAREPGGPAGGWRGGGGRPAGGAPGQPPPLPPGRSPDLPPPSPPKETAVGVVAVCLSPRFRGGSLGGGGEGRGGAAPSPPNRLPREAAGHLPRGSGGGGPPPTPNRSHRVRVAWRTPPPSPAAGPGRGGHAPACRPPPVHLEQWVGRRMVPIHPPPASGGGLGCLWWGGSPGERRLWSGETHLGGGGGVGGSRTCSPLRERRRGAPVNGPHRTAAHEQPQSRGGAAVVPRAHVSSRSSTLGSGRKGDGGGVSPTKRIPDRTAAATRFPSTRDGDGRLKRQSRVDTEGELTELKHIFLGVKTL